MYITWHFKLTTELTINLNSAIIFHLLLTPYILYPNIISLV